MSSDQQPAATPEPASDTDIMQARGVSPGAAERIADAVVAAREELTTTEEVADLDEVQRDATIDPPASDGAKGADEPGVLWEGEVPNCVGCLRLRRNGAGVPYVQTSVGKGWNTSPGLEPFVAEHLAALLNASLAAHEVTKRLHANSLAARLVAVAPVLKAVVAKRAPYYFVEPRFADACQVALVAACAAGGEFGG